MTSRAWLLAIAAALAGVVAALTWPEDPKPLQVVVNDRPLEIGDLAAFEKVCAQILNDRADFQAGRGGADIPAGLTLGQFAHRMSGSPALLAPTCDRAKVPLMDFLAIVSALEKSAVVSARLAEFERTYEERLASSDSMARAMEDLGRTPAPPPEPSDKPQWLSEVPQEVIQSLPAWRIIGEAATAAWTKVKAPGSAAGGADAAGDEPPK